MEAPETKKQRLGVGTAVSKFVPGVADQFLLVLAKTRIEQLIPAMGKIIVTRRQELLPVVLRSMVENDILSLVVLTKADKFHGFVELFDILRWLCSSFKDLPIDQIPDFQQISSLEPLFDNAKVSEVILNPRRRVDPYHPIQRGYSLFAAWETLSLSGMHRVPVVGADFTIWDLITHSMLVDFLWQNIEKIGNLAERPVGTVFASLPRTVQSVLTTTRGIQALRLLIDKDVNGLAVVDHDGRLVDHFSDRDLRVVLKEKTFARHFSILWEKNVCEIKALLRAQSPRTPQRLFYASPTDTFSSVVEKMAINHIHRLFMVESVDTMKPSRCISQTDVLYAVLTAI